MYLVTNREILDGNDLEVFGDKPNSNGPNELRVVKVDKNGAKWVVKDIIDQLSPARVKELKKKYNLNIDTDKNWHGSLEMACEVFNQAQVEGKSILFFVHGYNNDVGDVLKASLEIESLYNVIVVPFTWPANGGGAISGTASYLSDKSDARVSTGAFNRFIGKIHFYHTLFNEAVKSNIIATVEKKYKEKENPEAAASLYSQLMGKVCSTKINLLCHSMGNYLFKHSLMTSENFTSKLIFDNICLVSADTNNKKHRLWVNKLDVRKRVYIVINEDDLALKASRIKPGKEQRARLGHYLKQLDSGNAHYIDLTDVKGVGSEHTYFKGSSVKDNIELKRLFNDMFNGKAVEGKLIYHADNNSYRFP